MDASRGYRSNGLGIWEFLHLDLMAKMSMPQHPGPALPLCSLLQDHLCLRWMGKKGWVLGFCKRYSPSFGHLWGVFEKVFRCLADVAYLAKPLDVSAGCDPVSLVAAQPDFLTIVWCARPSHDGACPLGHPYSTLHRVHTHSTSSSGTWETLKYSSRVHVPASSDYRLDVRRRRGMPCILIKCPCTWPIMHPAWVGGQKLEGCAAQSPLPVCSCSGLWCAFPLHCMRSLIETRGIPCIARIARYC